MEKKQGVPRRDFLRKSVLGATGAVLVKATADAAPKGKAPEDRKIITRTLGRTGLQLPVISMGVMRADNPGLVKGALDNGMVLLDTAHVYQGGKNEVMVGNVIKDYPRESYVIATKVVPPGVEKRNKGLPTKDTKPEEFREMFETSLKRLQLDYVDILYMHAVYRPELVQYKPLMDEMVRLKKEGKVRFLGVSTHRNEPEVIRAAIEAEIYDVVLTAYNFRQEHIEEMHKAFEEAAAAGVGIVAMKTMAGGYFDRERQHPINTKAALKWALQNPHVCTAIPGFTTFEQLQEDVEVLSDITLTEDEQKDLQPGPLAGLYCDGCTACEEMCRHALPLPDLMRAYMYTYGYRETRKAQDLVAQLGVDTSACSECNTCTVQCIKGFDVAERVADVTRITAVPGEFLA